MFRKLLGRLSADPWYPLSRVAQTISIRDVDYIPKVAQAGQCFEEDGLCYQLMHNGLKVLQDSYYGKWGTDIIEGLQGHHEPQQEKVFYEVLKYIAPGAVMIELGCYWAYYSMWFAKEVVNARNCLIEPDPIRMKMGKAHFALNNLKGQFHESYISNETDSHFDTHATRIRLDDFFKDNKLDRVAILHADIEGAEFAMLQTCKNAMLNKDVDYFFISTHSLQLHSDCMNFLKEYSYQIIAEHSNEESCSGDGLIVAKSSTVSNPTTVSINKYRSVFAV
ncbi:MAG: hypothetical protein A3F09_05760 [Chlamydiae bacterium RIFCSPHIGHO2_12_FULL_49_11]|nr:MAG: hypothetical protein A3F09_05760 [Chlamydiae bacterium RIFCSPHIGHO2_12_FULL_49_11]